MALTLGMAIAACERVGQEIHSFVSGIVSVSEDVTLSVRAYGNWRVLTIGDSVKHVSASPYVIEIRVICAGDAVVIRSLVFADSAADAEVQVVPWNVVAYSPADSTMVFANRTGVALPPRNHRFEGEIGLITGSDTTWHSFRGTIVHRLESRYPTRVMERLRGL